MDKDSDSFNELKPKTEAEDPGEESLTLALPVYQPSMPSLSSSIGIGSDRSQVYPTTGFFASEAQPRQETSFCNTPAEYADNSCSGNVSHTAATTVMASPHTSSEYWPQTPFSVPSTKGQIHATDGQWTVPVQPQRGQVGGWMPPFRHNIFSSVDYDTSQALIEPFIPYVIPITADSPLPDHVHPFPHGLPDGRKLSFPIGSLSRPNCLVPPPQ